MIFGGQTEYRNKKPKHCLRPNKNVPRMRKSHDFDYNLNMEPNSSSYLQPLYSKFHNPQPQMISIGASRGRQVPMNYPPRQHIYPRSIQPEFAHQSFLEQPRYCHEEKPTCTNCRRIVHASDSRSNHSLGSRDASMPVYRTCSAESCGDQNRTNRCGCRSQHIEKCDVYHEYKPFEDRLHADKCPTCQCTRCFSQETFSDRHNDPPNIQPVYKTHEKNSCNCQNQNNLHAHEYIHSQGQRTRLPEQTAPKCTYDIEQREDVHCRGSCKCGKKELKTNTQTHLVKDSNKTVKLLPSTYISHFRCPNCSYSCTLNACPETIKSEEPTTYANNREECDNCCEGFREFVEPKSEVNECVFDVSEKHWDKPCSSKSTEDNLNYGKPLADFPENSIAAEKDCISCIANNPVGKNDENPMVGIFDRARPNQTVFLNVLQKEEVIWFSS